MCSRQLAIEGCEYRCWRVGNVLLEMEESLGEGENVSLVKVFGDEFSAGCYKADVELTFKDENDLGGAWMDMRWV